MVPRGFLFENHRCHELALSLYHQRPNHMDFQNRRGQIVGISRRNCLFSLSGEFLNSVRLPQIIQPPKCSRGREMRDEIHSESSSAVLPSAKMNPWVSCSWKDLVMDTHCRGTKKFGQEKSTQHIIILVDSLKRVK